MTVKVSKAALNLREELADLRKPSGIAGEALLRADSVQEQRDLIGAGRKNLIINGGFDVWQRGTSFNPTGSPMYTADRWRFEGASLTVSRSTDVPSGHLFKYSARLQNTSNGTNNNRSYIEDLNTLMPNGVPWVLSAWVKVVTGGISIDLGDTAIAGDFNTSSTWTKVSIAASSRNTSGANGFLDIFLDANTDAYITGIQLELGSTATEFEHRSYGEELALCQRYFQKSYTGSTTSGVNAAEGCAVFYGDGTTGYHGGYRFVVPMRVAPAINLWTKNGTETNQAQQNFTSGAYVDIQVYAASATSFNLLQTDAGVVSIYAFHYYADAEL